MRQEISLAEAIQYSMYSKRVFNSLSGGVTIEQFTPFDSSIAQTQVQSELSRFDPSILAKSDIARFSQPPNSFFGPGLAQQNRFNEGNLTIALAKVLSNGMDVSVGYEPSLAYLFFPDGSTSGFNPAHSSALVTRVRIPLLRGAGSDVNLSGVRAAERRTMQVTLQTNAALQAQLRSIEQAYWALHARHVQLRAVTDAIASSQRVLEVTTERYQAERSLFTDVARARVQLESLFQQKLKAEAEVQQATYDLAQLIGLQQDHTSVLVPVDQPTFTPPQLNREQVIQNAIVSNPSLQALREEIAAIHQTAIATNNQKLPQFDVSLLHRTSGLDSDIGNALVQMSDYEFNDLQLGLQMTQKFGLRKEQADAQAVALTLARECAKLDAQAKQVGFDVQKSMTIVDATFQNYLSTLQQLSHAQKWEQLAELRYKDPPLQLGSQESLLVLLVDYQTAIQAKIDAIERIADALAAYNTELAVIDEKQGVLLHKWRIETVAE